LLCRAVVCIVYEPIAYTLGGVLGIVVIVIIILMVIAYRRFVPREEYVEPETAKPAKPPDGTSTIGYPYPGYVCPPPPEPYVLLRAVLFLSSTVCYSVNTTHCRIIAANFGIC